MLNSEKELVLLFLSYAFVTIFLVHLVKFPHWLTESPQIINEYYVKDIFVNTLSDIGPWPKYITHTGKSIPNFICDDSG